MTERGRERALAFAAARREGRTWQSIGRMFGCSAQNVRETLTRACPPFLDWPESEKRPAWSKPDAITLRIIAEARAEMIEDLEHFAATGEQPKIATR